MTETASKLQIRQAWVAGVLLVAFFVAGVAYYGLSAEVLDRVWTSILERPDKPMAFRFVLQPVMAAIAAWRDGVRDARTWRSPFFWTLLTRPAERGGRLREALISTARIILLALAMDAIYQGIVFETFYPAESVIVALLLAFLPYLVLRGPISRIARVVLRRRGQVRTDQAR